MNQDDESRRPVKKKILRIFLTASQILMWTQLGILRFKIIAEFCELVGCRKILR